jgi:hypothetical protein
MSLLPPRSGPAPLPNVWCDGRARFSAAQLAWSARAQDLPPTRNVLRLAADHIRGAAMSDMNYVRLFAGPDGESHFEDVPVAFSPSDWGPPVPPFAVSARQSAEGVRFASYPPGWRFEHQSPRRMYLIVLVGSAAFQASDGDIRYVHAGGVLLAEDTVGMGHTTWNADDDAVLVIATMPLAS